MNRLPKYYMVHHTDDPRWWEYIADHNTKYNQIWSGSNTDCWYGVDGNIAYKGAYMSSNPANFENNPTKLTLDEYEELSKEIVPSFDKDNWMVKVDTPEKKKEVAEWMDAQETDSIKLVGHKDAYDNAYYGWKQGILWTTFNQNPYPKALITWEQFQTLQKSIIMNKTYNISRKNLESIFKNVCENWQAVIKKTMDKDPFADSWEFDADLIRKGYGVADSKQRQLLFQNFSELLQKINMLDSSIANCELEEISQKLFGERYLLQLLHPSSLGDIPEITGRAFHISEGYEVKTGRGNGNGGTWLTIHKI